MKQFDGHIARSRTFACKIQVLKKNSKDIVYPYALSNQKKYMTLYLTKSRGCSSLYKPNYTFLKNFSDADRFEIESTLTMETTTLDNLYIDRIFSNIDFIKIDVQGAELDILKGGKQCLHENILGVEVEVEFQPLYVNQPLFSDVDSFIRNQIGLQIQDLRKTYWKYPEGINIGSNKGQMIFGDALYFRSPKEILSWCSNFSEEEASDKIQMACVMGIIYGYLDYSLCVLNQPSIIDFLDKKIIDLWKALIFEYGKSVKYSGKGSGRLFSIFNLLSNIFQFSHEGWASIGPHCTEFWGGLRKPLSEAETIIFCNQF